jgi:hypothetical protein
MKISINFNIKKFFLILLLFLGLFVIDIIWLELIPVKWLLKVLFAIVILSIIMISVITFMLRKAVKVGIGKQVFVGLLLIIIGIIAQGLFFYSGKFKFEAFKNQKEVRNYFEKHYLIGSDANIVLSDLKEIGASCVVDKNKLKRDFNYKDVYFCHYVNSFISRNPGYFYNIFIYVDSDNKLVNIFITKHFNWG